ncbi:MAG: hypothetical protein J0L77_03690 [Alphaproteobacteria bacterium]|nr:hypothetical protein [Alphaproteobacteria bacterium]
MTQENGKNMKGLLIALAVLVVLAAVGFFVLKPKTTPATPDGMAQVEGAVDSTTADPSAAAPQAGMTEDTTEEGTAEGTEATTGDAAPAITETTETAPATDPAGMPAADPIMDPAAPVAPMAPAEVPADPTPVTPTTNVPAGVPTTPEVLNAPTPPAAPADTSAMTTPEMPAIAAPKAADQCGLGNVIGSKAEGIDLKGMTVLKPGEVAAAGAKNVVEIDAMGTIMRVICP